MNQIIEKKNNEIRDLGGNVQEYEKNMRLSAQEGQRLARELNDYREKYGQTTQEISTYKTKIQKLTG